MVELVKTVKCKVEVSTEIKPLFHDTLLKFSQACNNILKIAIDNKTSNKVKVQHLCYREIKKQYNLPANLVIRAIARVCASRKGKHKVTQFRPSSVEYDVRTFSIKFENGFYYVSLATAQGRVKNLKLSIGNYQLGLLKGQNPTSATLVWNKRKKVFYLHIVLSYPVPPPRGDRPVGVDLGINKIATASNKTEFKIKNLKSVRKHYLQVRTSLQKKGTRGAIRLLRRLSGKEKRICRQINHIISKNLIDSLKDEEYLVFENLKNIRQRVRVAKKQRRNLHSWSFGQLIDFSTYKAKAKGIAVVFLDAKNSSRQCSRCGHISKSNRRSQSLFRCVNCGFQHNADLNASINLAKRAGSNGLGCLSASPKISALTG
jgi:putative transposase